MRGLHARRLLTWAVTVGASLAVVGAAPASAAPTIELTRGAPEPVESITTQLGAVIANGGGDVFALHVKPTGGEGCAANPSADRGETVVSEFVTTEANPVSFSRNWTFQLAGDYRVCAWVTTSNAVEVITSTATTFHVRQPRLSLAISAPAAVSPNQTFQVVTTAQAETERQVWEYVLPNTGDGCPANAAAANNTSGENEILSYWGVTGGPVAESKNESLSSYGTYLFCAYFEYPNTESAPELSASAQTTVVAPPPPCVVPGFAFGAPLAGVEASVRAASCSVGAVRYAASTSVRRGGVLGVSPGPGTKLGAGAAVTIVVSAGRPCVVPSVRAGANVSRVEHLLAAADCGFALVHARSRHVHRGAVIGLGSHAHTRLFPLTKVRIVVSNGR